MKKIILLVGLIITGVTCHRSYGESIDSLEIAAMVSAQTADELHRHLAILDELATEDAACKLQVKSAKLPYSCYDARIIRSTGHIPQRSYFNHSLDDKCARIAAQTRDIDIQLPNHLPKHCLDIAREKIRINRYKAGMDFEKYPW